MLEGMNRFLVVVLAFFLLAAAQAEVYKWVDEQGNTIYSDEPHPGAEVLDAGEVQTIELPDPGPPPRLDKREAARRQAPAYKSISITSPEDEGTIREINGNFSVAVSVKPVLQAAYGHQVALYLDGSMVGEPGRKTNFALENIDRGAHKLRAAVLDADGSKLIESDTVTVYLFRNFIRQGN